MKRRIVVVLLGLVSLLIFATGYFYAQRQAKPPSATVAAASSTLVRSHAPVIGRADAPVTIVEFFDPSCETCRAFYPIVKQILSKHAKDVRLVLRYAPFHDGSEEAVRILETARLQGKFVPVLEALLAKQPEWARHDGPRLDIAWSTAATAGLDLDRARQVMNAPEITAVLNQDVQDLKAAGVERTPAFFVNGRPLEKFGAQQLYELVRSEIELTR